MSLIAELWQQGFHVFPVSEALKIPLVKWKEFQQSRPHLSQVRMWERMLPTRAVGIVCGAVPGLVVIDIDGLRGVQSMRLLPTIPEEIGWVGTPRGFHLYFRHPGRYIPSRAGILPGIDVRADGGYVVAPGSVTTNGRYWLGSPPFTAETLPVFDCDRFSVLAGPDVDRRRSSVRSEGYPANGEELEGSAGARPVTQRERAWARSAFTHEVEKLDRIPLEEGHAKNARLNQTAFRLGTLVGAGLLDEFEVRASLLDLWMNRWGKPRRDGEATISSGLTAGKVCPRRLEQQLEQRHE